MYDLLPVHCPHSRAIPTYTLSPLLLTTMANFELSWAVATGLLSIFAVIPGIFLFIHSQLPSQKIHVMVEALKEADDLLVECIEEGLVYGNKADTYRSSLEQFVMNPLDNTWSLTHLSPQATRSCRRCSLRSSRCEDLRG